MHTNICTFNIQRECIRQSVCVREREKERAKERYTYTHTYAYTQIHRSVVIRSARELTNTYIHDNV